MQNIDDIVLNFNSATIDIINVTLAFIMFGIALDLSLENFRSVLKSPKGLIAGVISQLLLLPLLTYILIIIMQPQASLALGMILIASCPGGNISNFISSIYKANVELSIGLTTISSLVAIVFTPINFAVYGNLYEPAQIILRSIDLDWLEVVKTIFLIIVIPIIVGILTKSRFPVFAKRAGKQMERVSMLLFLLIVIGALFGNFEYFSQCIAAVFILVLLHNLSALFSGYFMGSLFKLPFRDKKSLIIETGIQNSGLGLLIIFKFFEGLGGMAIIAAWWGIWHMVAGFSVAYFLRNR